MTSNCPWANDHINLKGSCLSLAEKRWLGGQIVDNVCSSRALEKRFGISRRCLRNYADRIKTGREFYFKSGRPPLLDQQSMHDLQSFTREPPPPSRREIVEQLVQERIRTIHRRSSNDAEELEDEEENGSVPPTISRSSVKRYLKFCRADEGSDEGSDEVYNCDDEGGDYWDN